MGKYGAAAIDAAQLLSGHGAISPRSAWETAVHGVFPNSVSSQSKGCPRDAFLSLCEMGVVQNVVPGNFTRSIKNKGYMERALAALRSNPKLSTDERGLWAIAVGGAKKVHNSQMDVLATLFHNGFIR